MGFYSIKNAIKKYGKTHQITPSGSTYDPATSTVTGSGTPVNVEAYLSKVGFNDSMGFTAGNYSLSFNPTDVDGNTFNTPKVGDTALGLGAVLSVREYKKGDEVLLVTLEIQG